MPFFCPRKGRSGGRVGIGHWDPSQGTLPIIHPALSLQAPNLIEMHFGSRTSEPVAPSRGVCRECSVGPEPLAQPAFPSARLSQGQMTSFSMAWSPDSPVPVSSESIRQVPLRVGTSILIWKKLQIQKESKCIGTEGTPSPQLTLTSLE